MNTIKILVLVVLLLGVALWWCSFYRNTQPPWIQKGIKEWKDEAGEIVFYGKIIDQFGNPVESAVINVDAPIPVGYQEDKSRKRQVKTDRSGCFKVAKDIYSFKDFKGGHLFVDKIGKDGYEYIRRTEEAMSFSYAKNDPNRFNPEENHPVVFHMRKKELTPTFLFEEMDLRFEISTNESGKPLGYDFIQRQRIMNMANPMFDDEPLVCDIQVKVSFKTNDATWGAVLSTGSTNGGIIAANQLLYEAPQDGYQSEWPIISEDHKTPKMKYLYMRSRIPSIYSRFEIEYISTNKEFFRLSGKSVTNPYGDRNLEQAADLPYNVIKQLTDEARAALRKNKLPPKPDIPKLLQTEGEQKE